MRVFIVVALILLAGCGPNNYKKFDLSNVDESQGVFIGKIDVRYNSNPFETTGCRFCAGSACQFLLEEGYVFLPLEKGPLTGGRLSCSYPNVCCEGILFSVEPIEVKSGIFYFGNLIFSVDIESFSTNPTAPKSTSLPGMDYNNSYQERRRRGEVKGVGDVLAKDAIGDLLSAMLFPDDDSEGRTYYVLSTTVFVEDDMPDVLEVFRKQVNKEDVKVEKYLFDIKLDEKEKTIP